MNCNVNLWVLTLPNLLRGLDPQDETTHPAPVWSTLLEPAFSWGFLLNRDDHRVYDIVLTRKII